MHAALNDTTATLFAPAGRASKEELQHEHQLVGQSNLMKTLMDAMPDFLLVLNQQRQIVSVNQRLLSAFGVEVPESLLGLRPGEAVNCAHFKDGPDGCGTGENCSVCGAVIAIMASQKSGIPQQRECRLMVGDDGCNALDLDVLSTPMMLEGEQFYVVALRDISSEKRRYVMERVFFHDILNNAGGIRGLASLLLDGTTQESEQEYKKWLVNLSDNLIEEINHQRRLLQAERGEYIPTFGPVDLIEQLDDIRRLYEHHERTPARHIELACETGGTVFTDRPLLRRIVGNMVINALEASKPGDTITLRTDQSNTGIRISVSNPGEMSHEVQLQLFQRSFSTKEREGRGLGTYSMKLFGERYLKGKVGFQVAAGVTTFFLELPLAP